MSKLERLTAKIFADNAPTGKIGQFGSALAGTKIETSNVEEIQALPAYTEGWSSAVISSKNYPTLEEMNGVMKVMSYQTAYTLQNGIPEYDDNTEYQTGSICKGVGNTSQYASLTNDNIGNNVTNSQYWKNVTPVNYSNITNCLLEVPQRIKYDLTDGTLTIKAGSVVIVPYGTEDLTAQYPKGATFLNDNFKVYDTQFADGKFFVWTELVGDISRPSFSENGNVLIFVNINNAGSGTNGLGQAISTNVGSGTSDPSKGYYYRTDENKVYHLGAWYGYSLPVALGTANGTNLTSIDQVFNGLGYIGSTVWVDKGVKGLIPNGLNEDGSLNNIEWVNNNIIVTTQKLTNRNNQAVFLDIITRYAYPLGNHYTIDSYTNKEYNLVFDSDLNNYYYNSTSTKYSKQNGLVVAFANIDENSKYTSFNPKQPFRAVDYNDVDGKLVISHNTILDSTSIAYNGSITCDLSNYLPNDGNVYEVDCSLWATSGTTNGSGFNVSIISDYSGSFHGMAYNVTRTEGKTAYGSGTCKIPVGAGRYIKITNNISSGAGTSKVDMQLHSYRKVR